MQAQFGVLAASIRDGLDRGNADRAAYRYGHLVVGTFWFIRWHGAAGLRLAIGLAAGADDRVGVGCGRAVRRVAIFFCH